MDLTCAMIQNSVIVLRTGTARDRCTGDATERSPGPQLRRDSCSKKAKRRARDAVGLSP